MLIGLVQILNGKMMIWTISSVSNQEKAWGVVR